MARWMTPVFDRTQDDVEFASQKIAEWIAGEIIGNQYVVTDLKGCLNVSDINRIEGNVAYLADILTKYHYPSNVETKTWVISGMPTEIDVKRIVDNVRELTTAYYHPIGAPNVPSSMVTYRDINDIEQNLYLIKQLIDCMIGSFKICNTFKSGSKMFLPHSRVVVVAPTKMATISGDVLMVTDPASVGNIVDGVIVATGEGSHATMIDDVLYVT